MYRDGFYFDEFEYISKHGTVSFSSEQMGCYVQTATPFRGSKWTYTLTHKRAKNFRRTAQEVTAELVVTNIEQIDKIRRLADKDIQDQTPGILSVTDGWQQSCFIPEIEIVDIAPYRTIVRVMFVLLDGTWKKWNTLEVVAQSATSTTGVDYPHDYPFDFTGGASSQSINLTSWTDSDFKLEIFGACTTPALSIGSNTYTIHTTVKENEILTVDSTTKEIYVTNARGERENRFEFGERGGGVGSGSYIFERIKSGENSISWNNSFSFNLHYAIEEGGIPWTRS